MSDLPVGWTETLLSSVVEILDSRRIPINAQEREQRIAGKKQEELFPYYGATGQVGYINDYIFDEPLILLGEDGVPFLDPMRPKAYLADGKYWVNNHAHVLKSIDGLSDRLYLCAFLNAFDYREKVTGTTRLKLTQEAMRTIQVSLAPLNEQKRIAEKLDSLLRRVDSCQTHLASVPQILKSFRQSVLTAATSGRLTEEWREANPQQETGGQVIQKDDLYKKELLLKDETLVKKKSTIFSDMDSEYLFDIPTGWAFTTWGKISEWITYGFTRPMPSSGGGVKLITAKDVLNFFLLIQDAGFTTEKAFKELSDKDRPLRGDLLITKDGTIGRATLVQTDEPFCINQSVAVCWLRSTQMNKKFLEIVANADFTQRFVKDKSQGMAIQHLSITDFSQCPVPVPPLAEQHEIARRVQTLFALAERLETRWQSAQGCVAQLTPSLLAKAFRGELVEQDPDDEPAVKLLERIRAQKVASK